MANTNTETKGKVMTYKEAFSRAIEVLDTIEFEKKDEVVAKLKAQIEVLEKKANSSTKKSSGESANLLDDFRRAFAEMTTPVTVTELIQNTTIETVKTVKSNQLASAVIKKLVDNEEIVKRPKGKKSFFGRAEVFENEIEED